MHIASHLHGCLRFPMHAFRILLHWRLIQQCQNVSDSDTVPLALDYFTRLDVLQQCSNFRYFRMAVDAVEYAQCTGTLY